ncbi:MAG: flagellin [Candidatus Methanoperedens sp.]|nr:flagellin [Candidatus Methanoperedens sp.]MCE8428645.1 flagellin [Candidatus Methanoperedens sp.]
MKANEKFISDVHAQAGIGTLIIFIAMVLVAAVAAAVLISTQGLLQQKAQKTGTETIAEVSSNLKIISIVGDRGTALNNYFTNVNITMETAAGAGRIDLSQIKLVLTNSTARVENISYSNGTPTSTTFTVTAYRDADGSFSATTPVINSGDLVLIQMAPGTTISLPPRSPYRFELVPETGTHIIKEGTTPSSYGVDRYITME